MTTKIWLHCDSEHSWKLTGFPRSTWQTNRKV